MHIPTGDELRTARQQRGLTQAELADRAGVSQPLIARIESEDVDPTLATLHSIVSAINGSETNLEEEDVELALPSALKDARNRAGYTQGDLADAANVSQPLISRIERDDVNPRASTLRALFNQIDPITTEGDTQTPRENRATTDSSVLSEIESEFEELRGQRSSSTSKTGDDGAGDETLHCPNCGEDLEEYPNPNFCPSCGAALEN